MTGWRKESMTKSILLDPETYKALKKLEDDLEILRKEIELQKLSLDKLKFQYNALNQDDMK